MKSIAHLLRIIFFFPLTIIIQEIDAQDKFDWVDIPAGKFTLGSNDDIETIEYKYQIMKYPVTLKQYAQFLNEALAIDSVEVVGSAVRGYYEGDDRYAAGYYSYYALAGEKSGYNVGKILWDGTSFTAETGYENHPVIFVTYFGAYGFAEFYNLSLPSNKEWEKAARENTGYKFPWGNNIDGSRANYLNSGDQFDNGTTPVGYFDGSNQNGFKTTDSPSPYGAYDMAGNVWEWISESPVNNNSSKYQRGGSWDNGNTYALESYFKNTFPATNSRYNVGFRCIKVKYSGDRGFRSNPDGWGFKNNNLWPVGKTFPDWDLFVKAFGSQQCEIYAVLPGIGPKVRNPLAQRKYNAIKDTGWGGSCFGFAISSLLFYDKHFNVSNNFPGYTNLFFVPLNNKSKEMVHKYYLHQFGYYHQLYTIENMGKTPNETLYECNKMLNDFNLESKALSMYDIFGEAHTVVPFRLSNDPGDQTKVRIYVYDSNHPDDETKYIEVDTRKEHWYYTPLGWSNAIGLFLEEEISSYKKKPTIVAWSELLPKASTGINANDTIPKYIEIYFTPTESALLKHGEKEIGYSGDSTFSNISEGMLIIPKGIKNPHPKGVFISNDRWECTFTGSKKDNFEYSIFSNSSAFVYSRNDVKPEDKESISYAGNYREITVTSTDISKEYNLDAIAVIHDSSFITYSINNISANKNDSINYSILADNIFQLRNYSDSTKYDLQTEILNHENYKKYSSVRIIITENSSHKIIPNWDIDKITIIVDNGMDGTVDDTLKLDNVTSLDKESSLPLQYKLMQNYPNPFNSMTTIKYSLPKQSFVKLKIYNILGKEIISLVNGEKMKGDYIVNFDGSSLASGIYFCHMQADNFTKVMKMVLLK